MLLLLLIEDNTYISVTYSSMNNAGFCLLDISFFASCKKTPTDSQQSAPFFDYLSHFFSPYESSYSNMPSANAASFREKRRRGSMFVHQLLFALCA